MTIDRKNFEKTEIELETNESVEEIKYLEDEDLDIPIVILFDDSSGDKRITHEFKHCLKVLSNIVYLFF